jgi:hypothetical protein
MVKSFSSAILPLSAQGAKAPPPPPRWQCREYNEQRGQHHTGMVHVQEQKTTFSDKDESESAAARMAIVLRRFAFSMQNELSFPMSVAISQP